MERPVNIKQDCNRPTVLSVMTIMMTIKWVVKRWTGLKKLRTGSDYTIQGPSWLIFRFHKHENLTIPCFSRPFLLSFFLSPQFLFISFLTSSSLISLFSKFILSHFSLPLSFSIYIWLCFLSSSHLPSLPSFPTSLSSFVLLLEP